MCCDDQLVHIVREKCLGLKMSGGAFREANCPVVIFFVGGNANAKCSELSRGIAGEDINVWMSMQDFKSLHVAVVICAYLFNTCLLYTSPSPRD